MLRVPFANQIIFSFRVAIPAWAKCEGTNDVCVSSQTLSFSVVDFDGSLPTADCARSGSDMVHV